MSEVARLLPREVRMRGQRIRELPYAVHGGDAVPLKQLDERLSHVIGGTPGPPGEPGVSGAYTIETLTGATGTSHVLANTPISEPLIFLRGTKIAKVASSPSSTEYTRSGATITTGRNVLATDDFVVQYQVAASSVVTEVLTGTTGFSHVLSQTPSGEVIPLLRGLKLAKKPAGTLTSTEYSISGKTITTGRSVLSTDDFVVLYTV